MDQSSIFLKGEESKREEIVINIDMEWSGEFNFGDAALRLVQLLEVINIERIFCRTNNRSRYLHCRLGQFYSQLGT